MLNFTFLCDSDYPRIVLKQTCIDFDFDRIASLGASLASLTCVLQLFWSPDTITHIYGFWTETMFIWKQFYRYKSYNTNDHTDQVSEDDKKLPINQSIIYLLPITHIHRFWTFEHLYDSFCAVNVPVLNKELESRLSHRCASLTCITCFICISCNHWL